MACAGRVFGSRNPERYQRFGWSTTECWLLRWRKRSASVSQPSRNAVDGSGQRIVQLVGNFPGPLAAEKLYLNQAEWIDIWIAQPYRAVEHGIGFQQTALTSHGERCAQTAFEFFQQHRISSRTQFFI